jgi:hypothetical protein
MGVAEYWRFDASGGDMYGAALVGEYLERGEYRGLPVHTAADGVVWGYSPLLRLNLRWNGGEIELQDPDTGEILLDRRGVRLAMESERRARLAAERELEEYRQLVRRLREEGLTER